MGYANIRDKKQHEEDAARIAALEAQVKSLKGAAASAPQPVIVEKTSKRFKAQLVLAWVLIVISVMFIVPAGVVISSVDNGHGTQPMSVWWFVPLFVGIVWLMVTKIRIWWNHH